MKKILSILTVFALMLSFSACKNNSNKKSGSESEAVKPATEVSASHTEVSSVPEPEPEPEPVKIGVESMKLSAYEREFEVGTSFMPIVTMYPANATDKSEIWQSSNTAVAKVNAHGNITAVGEGECTVTVTSADNKAVSSSFKVTAKNPVVIEPKYIDGILIVNKSYPLPKNYNPGVNPEAQAALNQMFEAARSEGLILKVASGFRSYSTQQKLYNNYVKRDGAAAADRYSARPGYSEHQTGLAFDINKASGSFTGTPECNWLAANAYKYGFILRYPEGKESITGYMYESWHYRYIGIEKAEKIYNSGLTLEEYYGFTSVYAD